MWKLLKYIPPSFLNFIKHNTTGQFRYLLRQQLGADYRNIPETVFTIDDGRKFQIGPDAVYWGIYYGVGYEPEVTSVVSKLVKPDHVVFDVGTNFGWYTTLFVPIVGSNGQTHSFEPSPKTLELLHTNLDLNNCTDRVIVNPIAIGDEVSTAKIHVFNKRSHSFASLSPLGETDYTTFEVPLTTLDLYMSQHGIEKIDFIKIDVEGSELAVLKGSPNLFQSPMAPPMLIEINNATYSSFGYSATQIWDQLSEYGYDRFYTITSGNKLTAITDVSEFEKLADIHAVHGMDEGVKSTEKSIFDHRKGVPAMAIIGKGDMIKKRLESTEIEVVD
jgi:FkbM family methyltransferase